jgi:hypothetical protein
MEGRYEGPEPLDRAYDLSSLSGEVEAVGRGDRSMQQCRPVDPRPGHLASQHRDLVAQHEQLGVLCRRTPRHQCKPPQHLAEQQIEQSKSHVPIIAAR